METHRTECGAGPVMAGGDGGAGLAVGRTEQGRWGQWGNLTCKYKICITDYSLRAEHGHT